MVLNKNKAEVCPQPWGQLTWFASNGLGNSDKITLGECRIKAGCENPKHHHPNCDEVLKVEKGKIIHTYGEEEFEMNEGDVITVPCGVVHNARNIGDNECVLTIVFTSAFRETVGE